MLELILRNNLSILRLLNLIFWILLVKKIKFSGTNLFVIKSFIVLFVIFTFWNLMMILSDKKGAIYLFFWAVTSMYEIYFIISTLLKLSNQDYSFLSLIISGLLSLPIAFAAILAFKTKSYRPVNNVDFYCIIFLAVLSAVNLRFILTKVSFVKNIESFFIFSGFIMYFGLHILATNTTIFDFLKNWDFVQNATMISLIYWLGSVLLAWKIRSKHM